jgi:hypothetical protein
LFRRNSSCSAEQETLGIPFRISPQRRKMFGILYRETKIESNTSNSVPNHSAEVKPTRNSVPWNKISCTLSLLLIANLSEFCSETCLGRKQALNTVCWSRIFFKLIFFMSLRSVPSFGIDSSLNLGMPRNEHFLPRNNGNHSESIPRNLFGTKFRCQP